MLSGINLLKEHIGNITINTEDL